MAETILFSSAEKILGTLTSLAVQEVCLVWGVQSDLRRLHTTLSAIKAVLLDAEEKQTANHLITHWLHQLKDVLYDAEDVLDDFAYNVLRKKVVNTYGGFNRKVRHFFSSSNPAVYRLRIGHQIKDLRLRLNEIAADKAQFNLAERLDIGPSVHLPEREMTHSFIKSSDIIGREGDLKAIVEFLMDSHQGHAGSDNVAVIPIVGMGGLGKTCVAKMVFNDPRVVNHFEKKLWVCLGDMKEFDVNQVMKKIGEEMGVADNSNPQCLQQVIRDNLQDKSLLLVLDDVWDVSRHEWVELTSLLTSGAVTKIVVTTRISSVATCAGGTAYNLPGLPHEECVSLFKKLAFASEAKVDEELMKIGEDIVKKCKGVPLAIRILGSLLFSKSDENEWLLVRNSSIWELPESQRSILPVLKFSYDHLPYHLKQCFVYCSIFPEDYEFEDRLLISFWMAHGLLQSSKKNQEPEDVGKYCIDELLSRGFFQDRAEGMQFGWSFKMHDLVRDLACSLGQEEFVNITDSYKSISKSVKYWDEIPADSTNNVVRSLILREDNVLSSKAMVLYVVSKFKYLRFLHLNMPCNELSDAIGVLKHLRYLDLSLCRGLRRLPDSICKLHNLQTLILRSIRLEELPKNIGELINLRYLWITTSQKDLPANNRIECLPSLQFLLFRECHHLGNLFGKSENVSSSIQTLIVDDCSDLVSLFSLSGSTTRKYSFTALEVLYIGDCPRLNLNHKVGIGKDREGGEDSQYLHLPRLRWLRLRYLRVMEHFPEWIHGCAPTLQYLAIYWCEYLKELPQWLPNLISLRTLKIEECPRLLCLPQGMERLTNLKQLKIGSCGELNRRCEKETGEDWPKIAHVPNISLE